MTPRRTTGLHPEALGPVTLMHPADKLPPTDRRGGLVPSLVLNLVLRTSSPESFPFFPVKVALGQPDKLQAVATRHGESHVPPPCCPVGSCGPLLAHLFRPPAPAAGLPRPPTHRPSPQWAFYSCVCPPPAPPTSAPGRRRSSPQFSAPAPEPRAWWTLRKGSWDNEFTDLTGPVGTPCPSAAWHREEEGWGGGWGAEESLWVLPRPAAQAGRGLVTRSLAKQAETWPRRAERPPREGQALRCDRAAQRSRQPAQGWPTLARGTAWDVAHRVTHVTDTVPGTHRPPAASPTGPGLAAGGAGTCGE